MTTKVEKSIEVDAPVRVVYNQWTQFEEFPRFMGGVQQVTQLDDRSLQWVAEIAGVRREWQATILEQVPDEKVAWAAVEGATNAGAVYFSPLGPDRTSITLHLEYEPEGLVEKAGDALSVVEQQASRDLEKFKTFIEDRDASTGAWRGAIAEAGTVGTPGVETAKASTGDSGKAGVSGTAKAAGAAAAVAAAGVAAAAATKKSGDGGQGPALDVVEILTADHAEATELVELIYQTEDATDRRSMTDMLIAELMRHAIAEEMYVYPAMKEHLPDGEQAVQHDTEEHQELEEQMKQLEAVEPADPRFDQLLRELEATLRDHVRDEEDEQFPQLRARIPHEQLVEIGQKVETAKRMAPTRPHPGAPHSEAFHKLVGPGVGLVDRLRDKLTGRDNRLG